jgi:hypothetical protein
MGNYFPVFYICICNVLTTAGQIHYIKYTFCAWKLYVSKLDETPCQYTDHSKNSELSLKIMEVRSSPEISTLWIFYREVN